jgi:uncharacterized protein with HEPN domain
MRRDDLYVADLADTTRAIREYLDSISRVQWDEDRVLRDAGLYRLLVLSEIASALPSRCETAIQMSPGGIPGHSGTSRYTGISLSTGR